MLTRMTSVWIVQAQLENSAELLVPMWSYPVCLQIEDSQKWKWEGLWLSAGLRYLGKEGMKIITREVIGYMI